jgi:hypothetical protein
VRRGCAGVCGCTIRRVRGHRYGDAGITPSGLPQAHHRHRPRYAWRCRPSLTSRAKPNTVWELIGKPRGDFQREPAPNGPGPSRTDPRLGIDPHPRRRRRATQGIGSARSLPLKNSSQKKTSHIATRRSLRNNCPFEDRE